MATLPELVRESLRVRSELNTKLSEIEKLSPDMYAPAYKKKLADQARAEFDARLDDIRSAAEREAESAKDRAGQVRPQLDADNAAALIRTEQAWSGIVKPRLEAGATIEEALSGAGIDAALGAERFAGAWLSAKQPSNASFDLNEASGWSPNTRFGDASQTVSAAVHEALATQIGGEAGDMIRAGAAADMQLDAFHQVGQQLDAGDGLGAALTAHYASAEGASANSADGLSTAS